MRNIDEVSVLTVFTPPKACLLIWFPIQTGHLLQLVTFHWAMLLQAFHRCIGH